MILLDKLIDILPPYFKQNDTYKDSNGIGILERFINVCGNYFKNDVLPDIDNIMSILDIDKEVSNDRDYIFINCIWEFLGSIPYGYGALYDDTDPSKTWKENLDKLPRAKYYDIIKYSISLYKIRGTISFYNILMNFYGLQCKVIDPNGTISSPHGYSGRYLKGNEDAYILGTPEENRIKEFGSDSNLPYSILYDSSINYDSDDSNYDSTISCLSCTEVRLIISGKELDSLAKDRVLLLLNRFRPVNVLPFDYSNVLFEE